MDYFSEEAKDIFVKNVLLTVDNINVVIGDSNYQRKYSENDDVTSLYNNDETFKRFLISSREQLRKFLLTDWYNTKLTNIQIQDVTDTLTLIRNRVTGLFTN